MNKYCKNVFKIFKNGRVMCLIVLKIVVLQMCKK